MSRARAAVNWMSLYGEHQEPPVSRQLASCSRAVTASSRRTSFWFDEGTSRSPSTAPSFGRAYAGQKTGDESTGSDHG
jgi:hypothetical protein